MEPLVEQLTTVEEWARSRGLQRDPTMAHLHRSLLELSKDQACSVDDFMEAARDYPHELSMTDGVGAGAQGDVRFFAVRSVPGTRRGETFHALCICSSCAISHHVPLYLSLSVMCCLQGSGIHAVV